MASRATPTDPRTFAAVSAVTADARDGFVADVDPEWTIAGKPNGGYLLSMLGRAAVARSSHAHVISAATYYLKAPRPGPVTIEADLLREGRSASHIRARMGQDGRPCVEALIITAELDRAVAPDWTGGAPRLSDVAYADCERLPQRPDGSRVSIMDQVEVRIEPGSAGFASGDPSGRGEIRGWLTLPGDEPFDPVSLLYAVDAFPPATFDIQFTGWVPTLELTAYVRGLPAPGPVRVLHRAGVIDGGRFDESCHVWDRTGRLVAHSTQLAGIRLG